MIPFTFVYSVFWGDVKQTNGGLCFRRSRRRRLSGPAGGRLRPNSWGNGLTSLSTPRSIVHVRVILYFQQPTFQTITKHQWMSHSIPFLCVVIYFKLLKRRLLTWLSARPMNIDKLWFDAGSPEGKGSGDSVCWDFAKSGSSSKDGETRMFEIVWK